MGADFLLAAIPACTPTDERMKELRDMTATLESDGERYDEDEDYRDAILSAIDWYCGWQNSRDGDTIRFEGMDYEALICGGMSWGDSPSDGADALWDLRMSDRIYKKLLEWARADAGAATDCASDARKGGK